MMERARAKSRWCCTGWLDTALILIFVLLIRLPGFSHSVVADWDESMYILVAREILAGKLFYVDIMQEKPLGFPLLMALAQWLVGDGVASARWLGVATVGIACLLLRSILLHAAVSRAAAAFAALAYALLSTRLGGMAANTEIGFVPFTLLGVAALLRVVPTDPAARQARLLALGGAGFGLAIWCKYITAFPPMALFLAIYLPALRHIGLARMAGLGAVFATLCWLPTLAGAGWYAAIGQWDAFWYWNIGFMSGYTGLHRTAEAIYWEIVRFAWIGRVIIPLALLGLVFWRDAPRLVGLTLAWLVAEAAAVAAPWKFWDHYFLLLFPPLCVLAAVGVEGLVRRALHPARLAMFARVPLAALLGLAVAGAGVHAVWARDDRLDPAREIAAILRADTTPGNLVWAVNAEPIIYVLAGLPVPTAYAFPLHLVSPFNFLARGGAEAEVARILAARPRYLVWDPGNEFWMTEAMRAHLRGVIARDYVAHAQVPGDGRNVEVYRLRPASTR